MDSTLKKIALFSIIISSLLIAFSVAYYFILRPIQQDRRMDSCLDSMWSLYGSQDDIYRQKAELCAVEFKGR